MPVNAVPPRGRTPAAAASQQSRIRAAATAMERHLTRELIPFWEHRCADREHGGYHTNFDADGRDTGTPEKYLNTQARLVWAFSRFHRLYPHHGACAELARHGLDFMVRSFWDETHGGWFWKVHRDGAPLDGAKIVYGQSFAIYALAEFALAFGDTASLNHACATFDLLQKYASDTWHGGYFENLEQDWTAADGGAAGGDRKGLDTHMHLMEAFTSLYAASRQSIHRRKLLDVVELIGAHMIDAETGCGGNQFDLAFRPLPAIPIRRTWNAERAGDAPPVPTDTTSYGHNVELAWLLRLALDTAAADLTPWRPRIRRLLDHALRHGLDREYGGLFRDGIRSGDAMILEKEFWQHAEALVGFLDGYELFGASEYLDAFENVWGFVDRNMIDHSLGEWRTLLDRRGAVLDPAVGNPWKVCYHSGRALAECLMRLQRLQERAPAAAGYDNPEEF